MLVAEFAFPGLPGSDRRPQGFRLHRIMVAASQEFRIAADAFRCTVAADFLEVSIDIFDPALQIGDEYAVRALLQGAPQLVQVDFVFCHGSACSQAFDAQADFIGEFGEQGFFFCIRFVVGLIFQTQLQAEPPLHQDGEAQFVHRGRLRFCLLQREETRIQVGSGRDEELAQIGKKLSFFAGPHRLACDAGLQRERPVLAGDVLAVVIVRADVGQDAVEQFRAGIGEMAALPAVTHPDPVAAGMADAVLKGVPGVFAALQCRHGCRVRRSVFRVNTGLPAAERVARGGTIFAENAVQIAAATQ